MHPNQHQALSAWLGRQLGSDPVELRPKPGDAGQRRYFELAEQPARLAAASPPASEPNRAFVDITLLLAAAGLPVAKLYAVDFARGWLLLEHLGQRPLRALYPDRGAAALGPALAMLPKLASLEGKLLGALPRYDRSALLAELALFSDWFVGALLGIELGDDDHALLGELFDTLVASAIAQPQGFVHRDYHCRNLMVADHDDTLAMIDYQDGLIGPLSYDLVSLLKDCYWHWPTAVVDEAVADYYRTVVAVTDSALSRADFRRCFDWMGLQRHLKVLGIFARLSLRDGKHGYLDDLPLVLHYTRQVAASYPQLAQFGNWFERRLMPQIERQAWFAAPPPAGSGR